MSDQVVVPILRGAADRLIVLASWLRHKVAPPKQAWIIAARPEAVGGAWKQVGRSNDYAKARIACLALVLDPKFNLLEFSVMTPGDFAAINEEITK